MLRGQEFLGFHFHSVIQNAIPLPSALASWTITHLQDVVADLAQEALVAATSWVLEHHLLQRASFHILQYLWSIISVTE